MSAPRHRTNILGNPICHVLIVKFVQIEFVSILLCCISSGLFQGELTETGFGQTGLGLIPHKQHLACLACIGNLESFRRLRQRKPVSNQTLKAHRQVMLLDKIH